MHPTPKNYDWSHEIADEGTTMVNHGPGGVNRYSGVIDTSKLNTGKYLINVESRDENLQANADSSVELVREYSRQPRGREIISTGPALPYRNWL